MTKQDHRNTVHSVFSSTYPINAFAHVQFLKNLHKTLGMFNRMNKGCRSLECTARKRVKKRFLYYAALSTDLLTTPQGAWSPKKSLRRASVRRPLVSDNFYAVLMYFIRH